MKRVYNIEPEVIKLYFNGYYKSVKGLPNNINGVYFIYTYNDIPNSDKIYLHELIYIGKADRQSIQDRVSQHSEEEFKDHLLGCDGLCFSYAKVDRRQIDIVENALIFMQQPPCNDYLKDDYNHKAVEIVSTGACEGLKYSDFTIEDKED